MSKVYMRNGDGETFVMPLEIPLYEGAEEELHKQALTSLVSMSRHFAAAEAMDDAGLIEVGNDEHEEAFGEQLQLATEQLISTIISLVSIADRQGIDINQEIWETPFTV